MLLPTGQKDSNFLQPENDDTPQQEEGDTPLQEEGDTPPPKAVRIY